MKNTFSVLIIIISSVFIMVACTSVEKNQSSILEEDVNLTDSVINEEVESREILTLEELKALLETSSSIEVKDTNNQTLGKISTGAKLNKVISDIFAHKVVKDYEYSSDENLIGIINFYPSDNDAIYGLIKEKFIYIEGHYFISKNNSIKNLIDYIRTNTEGEPIVGD